MKNTYSEAAIDIICKGLEKGIPLRQILRDNPGMPTRQTLHDWTKRVPEAAKRMAEARDLGEFALAEECLEIADDARNDWMERKSEGGGMEFNAEHVQRSKLRIYTRLQLLAKFNPKRWGDRVQHADADGGKLESPVITVTLVKPD